MNNDVQLDLDEMNEVETGFYEPGCNVVCSQQLRTVAFMADERIKLFDVDTTNNTKWGSRHAMQSYPSGQELHITSVCVH